MTDRNGLGFRDFCTRLESGWFSSLFNFDTLFPESRTPATRRNPFKERRPEPPSTNFLFEAEWRFDPLAQIIQAPRYSSGPELFPLPSAMIRPHKERYLHESSHLKVTQRGGSLLLDGLSIMQISVAARNDRFRF
ncbi:predicted protein [Histoplasma capsulatum var. duboisii H88]|uniref:Predicted protein n=1 Tax=Ajellomyces capsulatus (strain H88) TaxID=544711 RepID=F0U879_AJEC8|nr:predicted protein [Histoplasma capsulatum var. duboisii H88]